MHFINNKRAKATFTLNLLILIISDTNNTNNLNSLIRSSAPTAHPRTPNFAYPAAPQGRFTATPCCVPLRAPRLREARRAARVPAAPRLDGLFTATPCRPYPSAPQGRFTPQHLCGRAWVLSGANPRYFSKCLSSLYSEELRSAQDTPKVCTRGELSCQNEEKTRPYSPPCWEEGMRCWRGKRGEGGWVDAFVWHWGKKSQVWSVGFCWLMALGPCKRILDHPQLGDEDSSCSHALWVG